MIRPDGPVKPEKLTEPQRKELRAQWERGPQHTYGRFRARTQNALVVRGLAMFLDENGKPATTDGFYDNRDTCTITPHGVGVLCGCGGFVQEGSYVHAERCADRKTRDGWPKALRPRQSPLPSTPTPPARDAAAIARFHGTDRQECQLGVFWTALNDADDHGRGHNLYRGMVIADLGLDAVPVPPFTHREMQDIMFAAKMAALKILHLRKKNTVKKP